MIHVIPILLCAFLAMACSIEESKLHTRSQKSKNEKEVKITLDLQNAESQEFIIECKSGLSLSSTSNSLSVPSSETDCLLKLKSFTLAGISYTPSVDFSTWKMGDKAIFANGEKKLQVQVILQLPALLSESLLVSYAFRQVQRGGDIMVNVDPAKTNVLIGIDGDNAPDYVAISAHYSNGLLEVSWQCNSVVIGVGSDSKCAGFPTNNIMAVAVPSPSNPTLDFFRQVFTDTNNLSSMIEVVPSNQQGMENGGVKTSFTKTVQPGDSFIVALRYTDGRSILYTEVKTGQNPVPPPPPAPVPSPTPQPVPQPQPPLKPKLDGVQLYAVNCSSCHGSLENSTKKDRSAEQITGAINSVGRMESLKSLNEDEISAIAFALASDSTAQCIDQLNIPARIWLLTNPQYENTVRDLFSGYTLSKPELVANANFGGISNFSDSLLVSSLHAYQYQKTSQQIAQTVLSNPSALVKCDINSDQCIRDFIKDFGEKAFRRPISGEQQSKLFDLFSVGNNDGRANGVKVVVEALLQSPFFLYRTELGTPFSTGKTELTSYELASKLSYFLWNSPPDNQLYEAAKNGDLGQAAHLSLHAKRMISDPRARNLTTNFFLELLGVGSVVTQEKDKSHFPMFNEKLAEDMLEETKRFLDYAVWQDDGTIQKLFSASFTILNENLANLYGTAGVVGDSFRKHDFADGTRAGLLTQASLMSLLSDDSETQPIHRGAFVRERLLCQTLAPPPPGVNVSVPAPDPNQTTRERFARHSSDAACASCHKLTDPIGFGFENYDAIGQFRTFENNLAVDATGEVFDGGDASGPFEGAVELTRKLSSSKILNDCINSRFFMYSHGAAEPKSNSCSIAQTKSLFEKSGGNLRTLIELTVTSDEFRYRTTQ